MQNVLVANGIVSTTGILVEVDYDQLQTHLAMTIRMAEMAESLLSENKANPGRVGIGLSILFFFVLDFLLTTAACR